MILGEILNKIEEVNDEIQNSEVYKEIVEKTKAMKDTEEKAKFDPVNKELDNNVTDVSSTIKRKRDDNSIDNKDKPSSQNVDANANASKSAETLK